MKEKNGIPRHESLKKIFFFIRVFSFRAFRFAAALPSLHPRD
jgi:hypothetical protein